MSSPDTHYGRTLRETAKRHALLLLMLFTLVSSTCLLVAPLIGRRYRVHSQISIKLHPYDGLPDVARLPDGLAKELAGSAATNAVEIGVTTPGPNDALVQFSSTAATRESAVAHMQLLADQATLSLTHHADELASAFRADLAKQNDRLAAQEETLGKQIENFRLAHRGTLPDDPSSVLGQFEKLSSRLDDKQQRQRVVIEQIARLEAYKQNHSATAVPPPSVTPAAGGDNPTPSVHPEQDPEVLSLNAQLQLVNDMIDDDLNTKHRTEQHPDVVDLRSKQAALQKKIDAAKDRAAAGQPPPANVKAPGAPAAGSDPTLAASQAVDLQVQQLQAERDTLDVDVQTLTAQRDAMQKAVDGVMPERREYEALTTQLADVQKEHQGVAAGIARYDRTFPAGTNAASGLMDVEPLTVAADSAFPTFPQVPVVFAVAIFLAAGAAATAAWMINRTDHTLHTPGQAAALLEVPILGSVMELHPPGSAARRRVWRTVVRPLVAGVFILITAGSAALCYRHLADSSFPQTVHDRGIGSFISVANSSGKEQG